MNRSSKSLVSARVYIANQMFTKETGEKTLADGEADAVADGRLFIVVARW